MTNNNVYCSIKHSFYKKKYFSCLLLYFLYIYQIIGKTNRFVDYLEPIQIKLFDKR